MNREFTFDGVDYQYGLDFIRLKGQIERVRSAMKDGLWWSLSDLEAKTGDPQASISAQIRNLRKARFGGYTIERRRRGCPVDGMYEYRLLVSA